MHVDVVDVGALAVDDDVVAGRALEAVELHDAAARREHRRAAAREDVMALVDVAPALRAEGGLPRPVAVLSPDGEDVVDEIEATAREDLRRGRLGRRGAGAGHAVQDAELVAAGGLRRSGDAAVPRDRADLLGHERDGPGHDDRPVGDAHQGDGHRHGLAGEQVDAGLARGVVVDAASDDADVERGGAARPALHRDDRTARPRASAVAVDHTQATAGRLLGDDDVDALQARPRHTHGGVVIVAAAAEEHDLRHGLHLGAADAQQAPALGRVGAGAALDAGHRRDRRGHRRVGATGLRGRRAAGRHNANSACQDHDAAPQ